MRTSGTHLGMLRPRAPAPAPAPPRPRPRARARAPAPAPAPTGALRAGPGRYLYDRAITWVSGSRSLWDW
jgi:hypothetical protein